MDWQGERWGAEPAFRISLDNDTDEEEQAENDAFMKSLATETKAKIEKVCRELLDWSTTGPSPTATLSAEDSCMIAS